MPSAEENPIAHSLRTLSKAKRNYVCTSRKRSFGNHIWHQKISSVFYGWKFLLVTDHKPLTTILSPKASLSSLAAARLHRYVGDYIVSIEFCLTKQQRYAAYQGFH